MADRHVRFIAREVVEGSLIMRRANSQHLIPVIDDLEYKDNATERPLALCESPVPKGVPLAFDILAHGANILLDTALRLGTDVMETADVLDPATLVECLRDAVEITTGLIQEVRLLNHQYGMHVECADQVAAVERWAAALERLPTPRTTQEN